MVKDGDNVFFKTKHGEILSGVLVKGVVYGKGKKKYRPPADKIFKTKQEARKSDWNPYTKGSRKDLERKVEIAKSKLPKFTPAEIQEQVRRNKEIRRQRLVDDYTKDFGERDTDTLREYLKTATERREDHDIVAAPILDKIIRDRDRKDLWDSEQPQWGKVENPPVASDLGRSNLDALLRLGDVSNRIQKAVKKRQAAIKIQSIARGDIQRRRLTREGWEDEILTDKDELWQEFEDIAERPPYYGGRYGVDAAYHANQRQLRHLEQEIADRPDERKKNWGALYGGVYGCPELHRYGERRGSPRAKGWVRAHKPTLQKMIDDREYAFDLWAADQPGSSMIDDY